MCGIVGYVGNFTKKDLLQALDLISHRGPDDRGIFVKENVGLGHNRLSIIDLSKRGKQPMFDDDKKTCIVFNGEIYNYLSLKRELAQKYQFRTETDTEVILYAYKRWGYKCLEKLKGMFSFVIYDLDKELIFGARDRLGEKPLKYYWDGYNFAFSSEIKGLMPFLKNGTTLDIYAVHDYLTMQYVPAPMTGFKNVYKLPPGHYFEYRHSKLKIEKYWSVDFSKKLDLSIEEWKELLWEKMEKVVLDKLIADVPLGAFLSGGIDSSTVVALMAASSNKKVKTFSVGFNDSKFDETKYAQKVAEKYKTDHHELIVTNKKLTEAFSKLPDHYDEPFADNSALPMMLLSEFTRKKVKVALSGDGGDENFAGYQRYNVVYFSQFYKQIPSEFRKALIPLLSGINSISKTKFLQKMETFVVTFDLPFYKKYLHYRSFFDDSTKLGLYSNEMKRLVAKRTTFNFLKNIYNEKLSDIDNALIFDINSYLPEDLLYKTDIASMTYGLEVRSPFLDHELIELAAKIPANLKIKNFQQKHILKEILIDKKLLPEEVIKRPKRGFVAPINSWLRREMKSYLYDQINSKKFRNMGIFDNRKLDNYLSNYFEGKTNDYNNVFALLELSAWINKFF